MMALTNEMRSDDRGYRRPGSGKGSSRASRVVNKRNPYDNINNSNNTHNNNNKKKSPNNKLRLRREKINIATWNVKTIAQAGKTHNAILEMKRLGIDILGISEMRWPTNGQCLIEGHKILYSGNENNQHIHGVGLVLSPKLSTCDISFTPISDRMLYVQVKSLPINLNIIQVYAPTAEKSEEEIEKFYKSLSDVLKHIKKEEITVIMGDFNAKIGRGNDGEFIGRFGLGIRNERGERLKDFVEEQQYVILNTFFELPPRRLYTWVSPQDNEGKIVRNQIDYVMINKRYRNSCLSAKTYPGADISSDHNLLCGKFKIRLKTVKRKYRKRWDLDKLKEEGTRKLMTEKLADACQELRQEEHCVEETLRNMSSVFTKAGNECLTSRNDKRKAWMTEEILYMMEERRKVKTDERKYKDIQKQITQKIRIAKEKWMSNQCAEIEHLQDKHDLFNLHKKIKETAGTFRPNTSGRLQDKNGKLALDRETKIDIWKKYIKELFDDEMRHEDPPRHNSDDYLPINIEEVTKTIKLLKNGKSPGPDNLQSEFLKLLDDENTQWITEIFNKIYSAGEIPEIWLKSTFVTLPKKPSARECGDFRTISLMSHLLKVFLKIIHQRIYKVCEEQISRTQFGFRNALGTREALFCLQVLFQRARDVNHDVFACFIDYQKAFDRVQHNKLVEILRTTGINNNDLNIISNLYWRQTSSVRVEGECSDDIVIRRGVRQGCVLSPLLFNLYSEYIFREALEDSSDGLIINGECINNIRYADDTVIIASSLEGLQSLMNRVVEISEKYGLGLNVKKTKFMVISKNQHENRQLTVKNEAIQRVQSYTYLGTTITENWDHSVEIKCRIEKARSAFWKMAKIFRSHDLSLDIKIRLLRCYVFPVLLYGVESWTLSEASIKRLEAFEMWVYRRILRISWTEHVTNEKVLYRMNKDTEILLKIKKCKLEYLGHIMRNPDRYDLLQLILQGKIQGRRGVGRRRISWLKNLRVWFNTTTVGLFRAAADKVRIAVMIANIRNG